MIDYQEKIGYIAEHYGYEEQSLQLIEEMAELTKAINKLRRFEKYESEACTEDIADLKRYQKRFDVACEIADVEIMLAQIKYLLKLDIMVYNKAEEKINRQLKRIGGWDD